MADNRIGLEVDIPVAEAEKGVKSLRAQIAALKKEISTLDEADPKFDKLVKEAAMLEDKMGDINQRVKALASDTSKLEGFTAAVSGIAGGFAAAQGAIALFSGENEELQKSMLKVQAAMTMLNGIQEVANQLNKDSAASIFLKAQAEKIYAAAVGTSTGALKVFRLALVATGIGAIVVAVGLLVANWEKITKAINESSGPLKQFGEIFNKVKQIASGVFDAIISYYTTIFNIINKALKGDFAGAVDEARNIGKNVAKAYSEGVESEMKAQEKARQDAIIQSTLAVQKRELQLIEAGGKDSYAAKKAILENELKLLETGSEDYLNKQTEIQALQIANEKKIADERAKVQEDARKKRDEEKKKEEEEAKRIQDEIDQKRIEKEKEIAGIIEQTRKDLELGAVDGQEKDLLALQMAYDEQVALVEGNEEALKLLNAKFQQDREAIKGAYAAKEREILYDKLAQEAEIEKKAKEDALKLEQDYQNAKRELAISSAQGMLGALKDINTAFAGDSEKAARRAFGIQKALNIAETVLNTYAAAQSAFTNTLANPAWKLSPDGGLTAASIAAGVAVAGGLARVALIAKQQFQSTSASAPASGGGGQAAPTQTPQLNADVPRQRLSSGDRGEVDTKVFVVESEITNTQSRVAAIDRKATVR